MGLLPRHYVGTLRHVLGNHLLGEYRLGPIRNAGIRPQSTHRFRSAESHYGSTLSRRLRGRAKKGQRMGSPTRNERRPARTASALLEPDVELGSGAMVALPPTRSTRCPFPPSLPRYPLSTSSDPSPSIRLDIRWAYRLLPPGASSNKIR